jgi:flagellar basal-body rod protein FlgB
MLEGTEAITTAAIGLALDAASLRHQAIAANIANANAAGYVPMDVSFEDQLEDARETLGSKGSIDAFALAGVRLRIEPLAPDGTGEPHKVQLDLEAAKLAQNTVRYQALVKALNKHFAILANAVGDSKK